MARGNAMSRLRGARERHEGRPVQQKKGAHPGVVQKQAEGAQPAAVLDEIFRYALAQLMRL